MIPTLLLLPGKPRHMLFALALFTTTLSAQVRLTEIAPTNTGQVLDEDGDHPDWIELRNNGAQAVNLLGWGLSDGSKSDRWLFPSTPLAAGSRLLVFASGKNRVAHPPLHSDFKLNLTDKVALFDAAGNLVDSVSIKYLQPSHALKRQNDTGQWCTTPSPTPNAANGSDCWVGYAAPPGFGLSAGFYSGAQAVALTGGGEIRYTTDGSVPDANSSLYAGPIPVHQTTVIRARRFQAVSLPSAVATSTFFIDEPTTLAVVSISLPPADFPEVYDNYTRKGAVAVEYFDNHRQRQFVGEFAGYVVGNWSVSLPQKSLQFDVDEDYGSLGEITYPIFGPDKPITSYHSFRIRNEDDDWSETRMRDRIANELAAPTQAGRAAYGNVAAFINGQYWGHYVARERLDNYFVRDNYGANPDSVNMIKTHFGVGDYVAEYGTLDDFYAMSDFIGDEDQDLSDLANFKKAAQLLDLDNFTDYLETEIYVANTDWLEDYFNNFRLFKTEKNAPWKFLLWDVSYSSGTPIGPNTCASCDVLGNTLGNKTRYGKMLFSLLKNPEYRRFFINRFADLMNTHFLPARAKALIDAKAAELGPEIQRHHERWGTGDFSHWSGAVQLLRNFYTDRTGYQRQQIINDFQLHKKVNITLAANPPGAGTVKISTVIPPSLPWTGVYFHGNPVTVTAIPNPGYAFANWSANPFIGNAGAPSFTADVSNNTTFTANFTGSAQSISLKISEINYHSDPSLDAGDWFEIRNENSVPLDISDFTAKDRDWFHRFTVPTGTVIAPGQRLVFAENPVKFSIAHPGITQVLAAPVPFGLGNTGDEIHLYDRSGQELARAAYSKEKPWPCEAAGFGATLERSGAGIDPTQPSSWFAGCIGGSPGAAFSACAYDPVVTEINYKSAPDADAGDWIELYNPQPVALDLSGWQIRDDDNDNKFVIPNGTVLTPSAPYRVFYSNKAKFESKFPGIQNRTGPLNFGLDGDGDMVRLFDASGRVRLSFCFNDAAPWPAGADGGGYTLELKDMTQLLSDPLNWFTGCPGGSPGRAYDPDCGSVDTDESGAAVGRLSVWPNPASDALNVNLEPAGPATIEVLDALGRVVLRQESGDGKGVFRVGALARGVYWVRANGADRILRKKVVFQ